jgi:hypothetical protein
MCQVSVYEMHQDLGMQTILSLLDGAASAEILCAFTGNVVRTLVLIGDRVDLRCGDGTCVGLDPHEQLGHHAHFMDRGDVVIDSDVGTIKLCTVGDILRRPGYEDVSVWDDAWGPEAFNF